MRVIAGDFKGRRLTSIPGEETRPTADMIKETLFNIIGPYFNAEITVDLYAGTGSLGIEAVSRGVDHGYLVDNNPEAISCIKENVDIVNAPERFTILHRTAEAALEYFEQKDIEINLLFLDPPYEYKVIEKQLEDMLARHLLSPRALVVCETKVDTQFFDTIGSLEKIRDEEYGNTRLTIFQNTEPIGEIDE